MQNCLTSYIVILCPKLQVSCQEIRVAIDLTAIHICMDKILIHTAKEAVG